MLFISTYTYNIDYNDRLKMNFWFPYIYFIHSTKFKTKCLNNMIDYLTTFSTDIITLSVFVVLTIIMITPQLIFNGGYCILNSMYYMLSDFDNYLIKNNYDKEK